MSRSLLGLLAVAVTLFLASPVGARILTTRPSVSSTWAPWSAIVVGSGLEFQTDSKQSEYDFPLLLEYNFTERLKLGLEPNFVYLAAKSRDERTVGGLGDLETSVEYEFLRERRYRPALSAQGLIRWPTAIDPDLGTPGHDYSFGLIASKDLVYFDVDLNLLYTFVSDAAQQDNLEIALAAEWHLNHRFDVVAEVVTTIGGSGVLGPFGTPTGPGILTEGNGAQNATEGTLGLAWHANKYLKFEQGVTRASDHSWQFVVAWEWSFGEN
jgi:hypothetical protein